MTDDTETVSTDPDGRGVGAAKQRRIVRERYGDIAGESTTCCGDARGSACCGDGEEATVEYDGQSRAIGYSETQIEGVESGANLGLGCGNPTAIASLTAGETVLDLGSGAGFDCFLAAREVGPDGRVIGVDMTPAMVERARENVVANDAENVEFRLGEIEHLPVADATVDVIISNCVINLSPEKPRVFRDAFRVLRPGGRLAVSDVVRTAPFPEDVRADPDSVAGCVAGASTIGALESILDDVGFAEVSIEPKAESEAFIREWDDERDVSDYIVSAVIEARKPADD
ncbi:arsenite methyltransferase [Halobellus sp. GM3]|uniref:arsenite methyltransferase n=1 Tax=Halobellus sp. GM3 TaxID=3458410 RepID=UPI00403D8BB7